MINTTLLITIKENYLSLQYIIKGINYTNPFIGLDKNFISFYFFSVQNMLIIECLR